MASNGRSAPAGPAPTEIGQRLNALILDTMQEAVVSIGLDQRVQSWSRGAERLFGWQAEEALGRPVHELFRTGVTPGALEAFVKRVVAEGRTTETGPRRRKDGSQLIVEATFVLIRDDAGQPSGVLGVARDVTELARSREQELDQARLRGLESRMNEAELVVRLDGRLVYANDRAAQVYGYSAGEIAGLNVKDLRALETVPEVAAQMAQARAGGIRFETLHRRKDGTTFPVEVSSRGFDVGGQTYLHSLVRDLTDVRRADEERRLLAGLVSNLPEGFFVTDVDLRILEFTAKAEQTYGWPRAEVLGKNALADFALAFPGGDEAKVRHSLQVGEDVRAHLRIRSKAGHWVDLDVSATALRDPVGRVLRWLVIGRDISAREAAQQALRESEARFRLLADSAPVLVWTAGVDMQCTWFNKVALDFVGRPLAQELGRGWTSAVHPDDLAPALAAFAAAFERREPFQQEFRLRRRDGAYRWVADSGVPRWTEDGAFAGYVGSCIDMTDRRDAEAALREGEQRLARVLRGSSDGFFDWDLATGHVTRSPRVAELVGRRPEEVAPSVGGWFAFVHPEDAPTLREGIEAVAAGRAPSMELEYRARHADGGWRWLEGRARRDEGGGAGSRATVSGTVRDVTERRAAQERLQKALEANEKLVAELRAALGEVKALSGLLPICMYCKKIRDDQGYWERIDKYITEHSEAVFTHGMCPDCAAKHLPGEG